MKKLLVIGAGGHGSVVADAALSAGWQEIAFVDDNPELTEVLGFPVIGRAADLPNFMGTYVQAVAAIGNAQVRLTMLDRLATLGFDLPVVIHPSAVVSRFATVGAGTVVMAQAAVNPRSTIGRGCIINTGATVDHDCLLEEGVHICPGVHLAGDVQVGARSWIGIGSSVKQGVRIGADTVVGAGAAVVNDMEAGQTVVGVPARAK